MLCAVVFFAVGPGCGEWASADGDDRASADDGFDDTSSGSPDEMLPPMDVKWYTCEPYDCLPQWRGDCYDNGCPESEYACAFTRAPSRPPATCARFSADPGTLYEPCKTLDATNENTCSFGLTCVSPWEKDDGSCLEWCASTYDSPRGSCSGDDDVCLAFAYNGIDFTIIGGLCGRSCNPAAPSSACAGSTPTVCADVSHEPYLFVGSVPGSDADLPRFACVISDPGEANERDDCSTMWQHFPGDPNPPAGRCVEGLTCAWYQFADQDTPRQQCLRVCDAPEDCLPTEVCVSSLEFTGSVGEPVGVCESV